MRTPLFSRNQPGGVFSIVDVPAHPGSIFFVHSGTGTNAAGYGDNPDKPVATIDYAIGLCTADKGDVIYVMPGHAETIINATGLVPDVAGVSIIGLGQGRQRPTITFGTATTANIPVSAANVTLKNLVLLSGFDDIAAAITVTGAGCTIDGCEFDETAVNKNFLICILGGSAATADNLLVQNCRCVQRDAANTHFVSLPGTTRNARILRNSISGDFGTAAIGAAGVVIFGEVSDNYIYNAASDNDSCINLAGTGICVRNLVASAAAQANQITATLWALNQNYAGVISEDLNGILEPIAT